MQNDFFPGSVSAQKFKPIVMFDNVVLDYKISREKIPPITAAVYKKIFRTFHCKVVTT